jgi:hypothetical protein
MIDWNVFSLLSIFMSVICLAGESIYGAALFLLMSMIAYGLGS